MKHIEGHFVSRDNLSLYFQGWEVEDNPKAVVGLVHGLGEHSDRYYHVAEALNNAGYSLVGFDLRGHGKSEGQRGHFPTIDHLIADIDDFFHQVSEKYPDYPRFLYAHSLGGMLALNFLISCKPVLLGAVISAPGLRSSLQDSKMKVLVATYGAMLLPKLSIKSELDPYGLSHDKDVVKAYIDDPLVHDLITFSSARSMLEGINRVFSHASEIQTPMLVMHGKDDKIVYPSGSQELCNLIKGDCTLKLWDGLFHEIHNEPQKDEVIQFMIDWMDSHLSPG